MFQTTTIEAVKALHKLLILPKNVKIKWSKTQKAILAVKKPKKK